VRIRAVILEGEADAATIAILREAMESPELSIVFAGPSVGEIVARVAYETGLTRAEIVGNACGRPHYRARCAVAMLARTLSGKSSVQIGRALGDRDHSSILRALRRAEAFRETDPAFRRLLASVTAHFERERLQ
jgi:chromosomal replication initiation ATPase DnaA